MIHGYDFLVRAWAKLRIAYFGFYQLYHDFEHQQTAFVVIL